MSLLLLLTGAQAPVSAPSRRQGASAGPRQIRPRTRIAVPPPAVPPPPSRPPSRRRILPFRPRHGTGTPVPTGSAPSVAPSLRALGTVTSTTTSSPSFAAPAGTIATDVVLALSFVDAGTTTVTGVPTGFTVIPGLPQDSNPTQPATDHSLIGYWGRFSDVGAGPYVFTLSASVFVEGRTAAVQDAVTTGSPWEATNGATSGPSSSVTTAPAVSATSLGANRYAFYASTNWSGGAWTPPSGFVERWDDTDEICTFGDRSLPTAQTVTPQAVCANSARSNAWVGILLPVPGGTSTVLPPPQLARHAFTFRPRRTVRAVSPVLADQPVLQVKRPQVKTPRLTRSRIATPVPAQVIPAAPAYPPQSIRVRVRGLRLFRGRPAPFVPDQLAPPQPVRARSKGLRLFRGRAAAPVPAQVILAAPVYPPQSVRIRPRGVRLSRSRVASPIPAQVILAPPAYPPQSVRSRIKGIRLTRGRTASPVPAQVILAAPAYPLQGIRGRVKALRLFRGRTTGPVLEQAVPIVAVKPGRPRPVLRRPRIAAPIPAQVIVTPPAYPPPNTRIRLRGLRLSRGRAATPVPPQVILPVPAYPPKGWRARLKGLRLFRGRAAIPVPVCTCDTVRPSTGMTMRPTSGTTSRPGSGTTGRPGSGTTSRPDTGTTSPPCNCH